MTHWLLVVVSVAVVLGAVGVACFVMVKNRLPFTSRMVLTHRCLYCRRRFASVASVLNHELNDHRSQG